MMVEIKAPIFPESITDGVVVAWHKQPGEPVTQDENLVDIETDKVVLEVGAPASGILKSIRKKVGETTRSKELLGVMEAGEVSAKTSIGPHAKSETSAIPAGSKTVPPAMGPAARRFAIEARIEPTQVKGTGKGGRITKEDLLGQVVSVETPASAEALKSEGRMEQKVPMTRLRARIAERMVEAQQTAAILTTFNEVNLQAVSDLRAKYKDQFEKIHKVRLGFMSFFVKASVEALKLFPAVNAFIEGSDIIYHGYCDIGVAVSTPRGLVVPILRDAQNMGLADIERAIAAYAEKARDGKLTIEEMSGGTFTVSNGGVFGSLLSTPILNPPQSAILGMHKIEDRPVVERGQIVIRPMMYVALSYDHRIIDGKEAVSFLVAIKEFLENPGRVLLEI